MTPNADTPNQAEDATHNGYGAPANAEHQGHVAQEYVEETEAPKAKKKNMKKFIVLFGVGLLVLVVGVIVMGAMSKPQEMPLRPLPAQHAVQPQAAGNAMDMGQDPSMQPGAQGAAATFPPANAEQQPQPQNAQQPGQPAQVDQTSQPAAQTPVPVQSVQQPQGALQPLPVASASPAPAGVSNQQNIDQQLEDAIKKILVEVADIKTRVAALEADNKPAAVKHKVVAKKSRSPAYSNNLVWKDQKQGRGDSEPAAGYPSNSKQVTTPKTYAVAPRQVDVAPIAAEPAYQQAQPAPVNNQPAPAPKVTAPPVAILSQQQASATSSISRLPNQFRLRGVMTGMAWVIYAADEKMYVVRVGDVLPNGAVVQRIDASQHMVSTSMGSIQ